MADANGTQGSNMKYVLGIDVGTSGTKSLLTDEAGKIVSEDSIEYKMAQPRDGWAEQDPNDWWEAAADTIASILSKSGVSPDEIAGVGLSGQMHGLVMLSDGGDVIRPAILWCDGRTGDECREITDIIGRERLISISGNPALAGFTAGKILWVRKNEPENYDKCRVVMLPKDYVRYKLTGEYATDAGDASGTNLLDIKVRDWSSAILGDLQIDRALLPPVLESCQIAGRISRRASERTGLKEGTPVVAGSGDNMASAIGTGVVKAGVAFTTIGTSGVVYAQSDRPKIDAKGRIHTFCSAVPSGYALMGCTLSAGQSLKWFKNEFCSEESANAQLNGISVYKVLDEIAEEIPVGSGGLVFLPYLMGERSPVLDEESRGVFFGISAVHTKANFLRSVMEGVAFSQRACFDILCENGAAPKEMLICGGGGSSRLWRQMLADNYCMPVRTLKNNQGGALGAAIMAAVGTGIFGSLDEACGTFLEYGELQYPDAKASEKYKRIYNIYEMLYPTLSEAFHALADLRREGIV